MAVHRVRASQKKGGSPEDVVKIKGKKERSSASLLFSGLFLRHALNTYLCKMFWVRRIQHSAKKSKKKKKLIHISVLLGGPVLPNNHFPAGISLFKKSKIMSQELHRKC